MYPETYRQRPCIIHLRYIASINSSGSTLLGIMYFHTGRGLYVSSYINNTNLWLSGVVLFIFLMATAFLGYVLTQQQQQYSNSSSSSSSSNSSSSSSTSSSSSSISSSGSCSGCSGSCSCCGAICSGSTYIIGQSQLKQQRWLQQLLQWWSQY